MKVQRSGSIAAWQEKQQQKSDHFAAQKAAYEMEQGGQAQANGGRAGQLTLANQHKARLDSQARRAEQKARPWALSTV